MDSTLKKEQMQLKAFITSPWDEIRPPYGRAAIRRPRRTSFAATVNPKDFLRDETGTRRWWVVPVKDIDLDALKKVSVEWREQLWVQVYQMYLKNPQGFRLTDAERIRLEKRNLPFDAQLPYEQEVRDVLDFGLPVKNWRKVRASDIKVYVHRATAAQIGKVIAKMQKDDSRISITYPQRQANYFVPLMVNPRQSLCAGVRASEGENGEEVGVTLTSESLLQ